MGFDAGYAKTVIRKVTNTADGHGAAFDITPAISNANNIIVCDDLVVSVDTAMSVTFKEETTGTVLSGPYYFPANSGPCQITKRGHNFKTATVGKKIQAITSVSGNCTIEFGGHEATP